MNIALENEVQEFVNKGEWAYLDNIVPKKYMPWKGASLFTIMKIYKFFLNLNDIYGIDKEEILEYEWVGGHYPAIDDEIPLINTDEAIRQARRFVKIFPKRDFPAYECECLCETPIKNNAYIAKNRDYDTIIAIGSCCVRKFITNKMTDTNICTECEIKHRCKKDLCKDCKSKRKRI